MTKRILVILGHPASGALADSYVKGAEAAGNEVRLISLGNLSFDPVLHNGYATIQELEPDLVTAQAAITWAQCQLCSRALLTAFSCRALPSSIVKVLSSGIDCFRGAQLTFSSQWIPHLGIFAGYIVCRATIR